MRGKHKDEKEWFTMKSTKTMKKGKKIVLVFLHALQFFMVK